MSEINPAVRANLERVVRDERRAATLRMAWVRFVVSAAALLAVWLSSERAPMPTRLGVVVFFVASGLILAATRTFRSAGQWAGYTVPLLDVPLLSVIQHSEVSLLVEPWTALPTNVAITLGLVVLASLSLSRPIVWATAVTADLSIVSMLLRMERLPTIPIVLTALTPVAVAAVLHADISRIRSLLHASRKKDLLGKYVLGDRLGAGGMAEVFAATYSPEGGFERRVAVKRILPSFAENTESVALFRREAELGAMLAHPNIVQVLDFGTDDSSYFLAMEFVDGIALSRLLQWCRQEGRTLPIPAAITVAWMVAEATDYIHLRTSATGAPLNLIHRDLNPPNILVSGIGEVKVADFGIARASGQAQLTADGILRGKIGYSSPEQLRGQPYDSRADLFSLGVTLHETLTSKKLFNGNSDVALLRACLDEAVLPPSASNPQVPEVLDAIVMALLQRQPSERLSSAREVVTRLAALPPELKELKLGQQLLAEMVAQARAALSPEAPATPASSPSQRSATVTVPSTRWDPRA